TADRLAIAQAPLWGLGRGILLEHGEIFGGLIDLDPGAPPDDVEALACELRDRDREPEIAFRDGARRVLRPVPARPLGCAAVALRPDATYWITGGLGGIGLEVARWMVERGARHLALTGRRSPEGPAAAAVRAIEAMGARVAVVAGDVARPEDVARV